MRVPTTLLAALLVVGCAGPPARTPVDETATPAPGVAEQHSDERHEGAEPANEPAAGDTPSEGDAPEEPDSLHDHLVEAQEASLTVVEGGVVDGPDGTPWLAVPDGDAWRAWRPVPELESSRTRFFTRHDYEQLGPERVAVFPTTPVTVLAIQFDDVVLCRANGDEWPCVSVWRGSYSSEERPTVRALRVVNPETAGTPTIEGRTDDSGSEWVTLDRAELVSSAGPYELALAPGGVVVEGVELLASPLPELETVAEGAIDSTTRTTWVEFTPDAVAISVGLKITGDAFLSPSHSPDTALSELEFGSEVVYHQRDGQWQHAGTDQHVSLREVETSDENADRNSRTEWRRRVSESDGANTLALDESIEEIGDYSKFREGECTYTSDRSVQTTRRAVTISIDDLTLDDWIFATEVEELGDSWQDCD